jgi:hypothetical protein
MRVLPQSVMFVYEDRPLFRVVEHGGLVIDYELEPRFLVPLARQALNIELHAKEKS